MPTTVCELTNIEQVQLNSMKDTNEVIPTEDKSKVADEDSPTHRSHKKLAVKLKRWKG